MKLPHVIPVFKDRRLIIFNSTNSGVLDFEGSKFKAQEFNLRVPAAMSDSKMIVEQRIREVEQTILNRFFDDEFLYLTSRRENWERIVGRGNEVVYQATVSATYVKMVRAHDELTSQVVRGK